MSRPDRQTVDDIHQPVDTDAVPQPVDAGHVDLKPPLVVQKQGFDARWYVQKDQQRFGPFSRQDLRQWLRQGKLKGDDLVWHPAFPGWRRLVTCHSFFGAHGQSTGTENEREQGGDATTAHSPYSLTFPSDAWPLTVLAVLICCHMAYFVTQDSSRGRDSLRFEQRARVQSGTGPDRGSPDRGSPDRGSVELADIPHTRGRSANGSAKGFASVAEQPFDLTICNDLVDEEIFAAVAYFDPSRGDWVSRGWYAQEARTCQETIRQLTHPVYVYAESLSGQSRPAVVAADDGLYFCIDPKSAFVYQQEECWGHAKVSFKRFARLGQGTAADPAGAELTWRIGDGLGE